MRIIAKRSLPIWKDLLPRSHPGYCSQRDLSDGLYQYASTGQVPEGRMKRHVIAVLGAIDTNSISSPVGVAIALKSLGHAVTQA